VTAPSSSFGQAGRSVAVALFEREAAARQAVQSLAELGLDSRQLGVFVPGAAEPSGQMPARDATGLLIAVNRAAELTDVLVGLGVPEGEARYYADEVRAGRSLVVAAAGAATARVRQLLRQGGGYDIESRGEQLVRGPSPASGTGASPAPPDLTMRWEDVDSRYETLWRQHYGTSDASWEEYAPVYRWAWQQANRPELRGRAWSEVAPRLEREWQSMPGSLPWQQVSDPVRDVWQDVADEARRGAEGGADRRTLKPLE
jgi:hypothetical protein